MKTKFKLSCLFLAALMLFSLTACGKDSLRQGQPGAQLDIGRNRADKASCGSGKRNNDPYKSVGSYLR